MAEKFKPRQAYDLIVDIGGENFSSDLIGCNISYNLSTIYPIVELSFLLTPDSVLLDQIYGDKIITLIIHQLAEQDGSIIDTLEYKLLQLESKLPLPIGSKVADPEKGQKDYVQFDIIAIPIEPFLKYKKLINKLYTDTTLEDIVLDIARTAGFTVTNDNFKNLQFSQFLLPPSSCISHLGYLKDSYGLFDGIPIIFSDEESNLYLYNLTRRFNEREAFTATQLSIDDQNNINKIENLSENQYIVTRPIKSSYNINSLIGAYTYRQKYIGFPSNKLYEIYETNIETIIADYGLKHSNNNLFIENNLKNLLGIDTGVIGVESNHIISKSLLKAISNLSKVSFIIERGFNLSDFKKVGDPFILDFTSEKYKELYGKYITFGVNYTFRLTHLWFAHVEILGVRSTKVY